MTLSVGKQMPNVAFNDFDAVFFHVTGEGRSTESQIVTMLVDCGVDRV